MPCRLIRAFLIQSLVVLGCCASLYAAPPQRSDLPADISSLVHVDVEALQASAFGRELISKVAGLPKVKQLLSTLPEGLTFLKQVRMQDITFYEFPDSELHGNTNEPVFTIRLQADQDRLLKLLSMGRDYAQLSYEGVAVHHWRPNLEAIRDVIQDDGSAKKDAKADKEEEEMPVCYLAIPKPGVVVISRSLPLLNRVLDRRQDRGEMLSQKRYDAWIGSKPAWVTVGFDQTDEFPKNGIARLYSEPDGRITLTAETVCRDQSSKLIAGAVFGALNNPEQLGAMVAGMWRKKEDKGAEKEEPTDNKRSKNRGGSFTFGISVDGHPGPSEVKKEDLPKMTKAIGELVAGLIDCSFEDGRLALKATAYPGSWDVNLKNGKTDDLSIQLHLFSTEAKYLAKQPKETLKQR